MNHNGVMYRDRRETVDVLSAFIASQVSAMRPEQAALAEATGRAHYDEKALNLEGVARLLWGAVPLANDKPELLNVLLQAVINGVNPEHDAYWGEPVDFSQRCVEMSAIAMAIVDGEYLFFDRLNTTQQQHLIIWLQSATDIRIPNNNWHFFRVLILMALRHVGAEYNATVLQRDLLEIDNMYLGDGWYRDGRSGCTDYYNPFAFHYYGLLFARWVNTVTDDLSSELNQYAQLFIHRAALFAQNFALWTGEDGAPIAYGRSMSYRFAGAGIWSELACYPAALARVSLSVSDMKTLWAATLRWWSEQPIVSEGTLSVGFTYPNLIASEFYNSPMSPLLALKGFAAVRLPEGHPFWQAKESQIIQKSTQVALEKNKQLVARHNGISVLLTGAPSAAELRNSHDKYLKFAYSSAHGFGVEALRWIEQGFIGDNVMACQHPESKAWSFRNQLLTAELREQQLITVWQPFEGCVIETAQWFEQGEEYRRHTIDAQHDFDFILSGHAVDTWVKCIGELEALTEARLLGATVISELQLLNGEGQYGVMPCAPNTNIRYAQAAVPVIHGKVAKGHSVMLMKVITAKQ
ncbi:hypothetical/partial homology [Photobacterium aphoticum]|uniref:Hypothetical/partial homology n=1 Tax=Photobacterium aphoticum TaxID=754436 RepID=A0A090QSM0_9GAMM|nr:hypothetical/partial homology [Photobacterium aphoticum]